MIRLSLTEQARRHPKARLSTLLPCSYVVDVSGETMDNINELAELYNSGISFSKIAEMFNYSYKKVRTSLIDYGIIPRVMSKKFSENQIQDILEKYKNNVSAQRIAKDYGVCIQRIKKIIIDNGEIWDNAPTNYKFKTGYKINRDCFSEFNTESELYFFGLLLADGCIISNSNRIQLDLHSRDVDVLDKFCSFLGLEKSPRKLNAQDAYSVRFSDSIIADKLRWQGLESSKSLREKPPKFYTKENLQMRHFWRGFIDGDGSVNSLLTYRSRYLSLIGTLEMLTAFEDFCRFHLNLGKKAIVQNKTVKKNCYEIRYTGIQSSKIAKLLYSDSAISLDRKKKEADHLASMSDIIR